MLNETYTTSQLTDTDGSTLGHTNDAVVQLEMSIAAAAAFWQEALRDCDIARPMSLPFDRHRAADESQTGRRTSASFEFGDDLSQAALTYASTNSIEPEYLFLACYYAFLFKLTNGERDLCVSMNTDGRYTPEPCSMIDMSVNTIPLRYRVHPHKPFGTLVEGVRLMAIRSLKYSYYTLQRILAQHPHVSKAAFLDTSFEFRSNPSQLTNGSLQLADVILQAMPVSLQISADQIVSKPNFTLNVEHDIFTSQLSFTIQASLDLFDPETIDKIAQRFLLILKQLFEFSVDRPIYELSLILSNEMALIRSLNSTKVAFPPVGCVHHEFACQASEHSQKVAVVLDEQSLTYGELLHSVWLLSLHLREKVELGDIVCQCTERSIEMVVGLLAILTCGASYCPVSPSEPLARLSTVVRDAGAKIVLTHRQTSHQIAETCPSSCVIEIDSILNAQLMPEKDVNILDSALVKTARIAYVIFTSGTSGKPKAVTVSHSHFLQYLQSSVHVDAFRPSDIIAQVSSCTWDVHLHEILGSLLGGGSVVLLRPDQSNRNMDYLARIVEQQQVTAICVVPTLLAILFDTVQAQQTLHRLRTVRLFWSTGEPIQCFLAARVLPLLSDGCKLINFGGATEGTVAQTIRIVTEFDKFSSSGTVPLGRPMPNFRCYVLDEYFQLVPVGYMGELYIGGPIMDGYLNQPELNTQVLIRISYESNKCYKTGDLARLLPESGEIQLYGRKDFQLKLRGQRVDLNEIEATIYRYGVAVSKCVVIKTVELEQEHLVAYIQLTATVDASQFDEHQIRTVCQTHLPQWMVPSFFIILNQLPLNVNGKVDRAALPKPDLSLLLAPTNTSNDNQGDQMPMTTDQQRVHDLWRTLFHLSNETRIPVDCSFFSLGGNSLDMMRLYVEYQASFQFDWSSTSLKISTFFRQSTIAEHARILGSMALRPREERQDSQPRPNLKIIEDKAHCDAQGIWQGRILCS